VQARSGVAIGTTLMTDEHKSYTMLRTYYKHETINHSKYEYVKAGDIHTNGIENFWSNFKRGLYGIYHHVSKKYLQAYIAEFMFRYNNRFMQGGVNFDAVLGGTIR